MKESIFVLLEVEKDVQTLREGKIIGELEGNELINLEARA